MVPRSFEQLPLTGRQFIQMGINVLDTSVFAEQLSSPNFTDALHSGHIVGSVSAYRQDIDYLLRPLYAIPGTDGGNVQYFVLSPALSRLVLEDMLLYQLAVILVGGHHIHVETLPCAALCHRSDDIVRLESGNHQDRDVQGFHYLRKRLQGIPHKLRSLTPVRLVGGIHLVSERSSRRVETHCDMRRCFFRDEFQQIFGKTEKDGSVHPFCIYHRPAQKGIIHLEDECVAVYEEKFHLLLLKPSNIQKKWRPFIGTAGVVKAYKIYFLSLRLNGFCKSLH